MASLQDLIANNDRIRDAICQTAMPMAQQLPPVAIAGNVSAANNIVTINPKLTGLLTGILLEVSATLTNNGANVVNRTNWGAANLVDRIQFTDLNNYLRHNSKGYHFALLQSCKLGAWYSGAVAPNLPWNVGNVNTVVACGATLANGANATVRMFYWVPIAYNANNDLRGAIFSQITNAQMQLQVTINTTPGVVATDSLNAMYSGAVAATDLVLSAVTIQATQYYYDQLPRGQDGQVLLPYVDMSENYMVNDTTWNNLTANVENTFPFANYRTFLSTSLIYDNAAVFNTGSDISYFKLQYANSIIQWQKQPRAVFNDVRNQIGFDLPPATYYFDHRTFPIATANYGNCDLVAQPSSVGAAAFFWVGYETFARNNTLKNATSLPNG